MQASANLQVFNLCPLLAVRQWLHSELVAGQQRPLRRRPDTTLSGGSSRSGCTSLAQLLTSLTWPVAELCATTETQKVLLQIEAVN